MHELDYLSFQARFVEYTDSTFSKVVARSPEEEHLGILGPTLRAEVIPPSASPTANITITSAQRMPRFRMQFAS